MTISRKNVGIDKVQKARRENTEAHAPELIAEEMSLRDLRKALGMTQVRLAKEMGIEQRNISRIERRDDVLISTLSSYLKAMGGGAAPCRRIPPHGADQADRI